MSEKIELGNSVSQDFLSNSRLEMGIATDFDGSTGDPLHTLDEIAEAGFTHIHWCHHWNTDFMYTESEIRAIREHMERCGLRILGLHGSKGPEKNWCSDLEYARKAGVKLVENRLRMLAELGGIGALVMHSAPTQYGWRESDDPKIREVVKQTSKKYGWKKKSTDPDVVSTLNKTLIERDQVKKSISELMPVCEETGIPIAVENCADDDFTCINELLKEFPPELFGICYDCGHGNIGTCLGIDNLETVKDRLLAIHLHDNDGKDDLHQPPLTGTINWERLIPVIKSSSYKLPLNFELDMTQSPWNKNRKEFLSEAYNRCRKIALI